MLRLIASLVPAARFFGCITGAPSQADADRPESQEKGFLRGSYPTVWFAIPSNLISLRFPLGHSGPVLTLNNAARASLPSPRLLVANAGIYAASLLGELLLGT